ncbi:MAG TPA: TRAP transporter substrate-binding protein [Candidatus Baltobacteraceae bacterium]
MKVSRKVFATSAVSALSSIAVIRAPARAAQFQMKIGHNLPVDHPVNVRSVQMWDAVRKETAGQLDVQIFPNNQLGGDSAMLSQVRSGALQFMFAGSGPLSSLHNLCAIEETPFVWRTNADALRAMDNDLGDYVRKELRAKTGLVSMRHEWLLGFRQITSSNHPIRVAEDLVGFKIRVSASRIILDTFRALGASPVPLNFSESYTAMQTHVVDGQEGPYSTIELGRLYEVQKYLSVSNHIWGSYFLIANGDAWKSLPGDVQAVIEKNAEKYALLQRRDEEILDASVSNKLKRQGLAFNECDVASFRTKLASQDFYVHTKAEYGDPAWSLMEKYSGKIG